MKRFIRPSFNRCNSVNSEWPMMLNKRKRIHHEMDADEVKDEQANDKDPRTNDNRSVVFQPQRHRIFARVQRSYLTCEDTFNDCYSVQDKKKKIS